MLLIYEQPSSLINHYTATHSALQGHQKSCENNHEHVDREGSGSRVEVWFGGGRATSVHAAAAATGTIRYARAEHACITNAAVICDTRNDDTVAANPHAVAHCAAMAVGRTAQRSMRDEPANSPEQHANVCIDPAN